MATEKQKRAAKILVENGRKSVSQAMKEAGYSPVTATHPSKLTNSDGWAELMERYLPDEKLAQVHRESLDATKIHSSPTEPDVEVPDHQIRLKATELGYKLKRRISNDTAVNFNDIKFIVEYTDDTGEVIND